jgi:hypothetical protein
MSEFNTIFTSVFHRILDFKSGVEFLFRPLFFYTTVALTPLIYIIFNKAYCKKKRPFPVLPGRDDLLTNP